MIEDSATIPASLLLLAGLAALTGSTAMVFIFLMRKGRLSMDEDAKYRMMAEDE